MELVCGASAANNPPHPAPTDTTAVGHEISHVPTRSQIYPVYEVGPFLLSALFTPNLHSPQGARPSTNSTLNHRHSDARAAENGFAAKSSVNKSAKVVLGRVLINAQVAAPLFRSTLHRLSEN